MNAIILSIGDELALGQTVDTNSAWISQQLAAVGCDIRAHITIPDGQPAIEQAMRESIGRCDFLIVSGGIGPTEDDLTRQALAAVMNVPLGLNEEWMTKLLEFFQARGRVMPETNKIQAMIPRGATMIDNSAGTAAGIHATLSASAVDADQSPSIYELQGRPLGRILTKLGKITREQVVEALTVQKRKGGRIGDILVELEYCTRKDCEEAFKAQTADANYDPKSKIQNPKCDIFVMPGVPKEMKVMFTRDVLPRIAAFTGGAVILSRTLHTFGLGESWVAEKLGDLMKRDRNPSVGTTVSHGIVSLRINARFGSRDEAQKQLDETTRACEAALGDIIFGADDDSLPQVVGGLLVGDPERSRGASSRQTVTTAESCTGGLLAKMLTDISGSSDYFKTGFITYSNEAKTELLGVDAQLIAEHGAVSEPVARAMAAGALKRANADFALSITGIAGPIGGTPEKPVGTVCIALATQSSIFVRTFNFPGDREMIRDRSAKMALAMLRFRLLGKDLPF